MTRIAQFGRRVCLSLGVAFTAAVPAQASETHDLPQALTDADFPAPFSAAEIELGWLLFYDPILSGNKNISCGTCHHPLFGTSDGMSLGMGEGGIGIGPDRVADAQNTPEQRIPRNSPALFNLGHKDLRVLFHDGRIEVDDSKPSGLRTPLGEDMAKGFASLLSAQSMFPVLSADEMAGHYGENDVSDAVRRGVITGDGGAWDILAGRVAAVPEYQALYEAAYPELAQTRAINFADISNAIAAFIAVEWRADQSPFDAYLRGEAQLAGLAAEGLDLFYGAGGCAACHSGPLQTDQSFHAMADPQIGPGKAARFESHQEDHGRFRVTGRSEDLYAFRTPSLRNVTETGPWGHAGAFADLRTYLRHHAAPSEVKTLDVVLPALETPKADFAVYQDQAISGQIQAARVAPDAPLAAGEVEALVAFLAALTDEASLAGRLGVPDAVPSGLPVDR